VRSLAEIAADPALRTHLAETAERISQASDPGEVQALLHSVTQSLGAERSFFASISGEGADARYTFVLDCDPAWWHRYRSACSVQSDPWLLYAARHSSPRPATQLGPLRREQQLAIEAATAAGFVSAALVPAHSGRSERRASLLCLGHSVAGYFEDPTFAKLRVGARSLAIELHDWWTNYEQSCLARQTRLSEADVRLLQRHCAGMSSKQIAAELQVSRESINSRFQRINDRLGVTHRRTAARIAVECGLIVMER
jgi:DNA-binding CsgD family transcriptional regulator